MGQRVDDWLLLLGWGLYLGLGDNLWVHHTYLMTSSYSGLSFQRLFCIVHLLDICRCETCRPEIWIQFVLVKLGGLIIALLNSSLDFFNFDFSDYYSFLVVENCNFRLWSLIGYILVFWGAIRCDKHADIWHFLRLRSHCALNLDHTLWWGFHRCPLARDLSVDLWWFGFRARWQIVNVFGARRCCRTHSSL